MRLIWVDDDADGLLSPLQYRFQRHGFGPIVPLHFYEDAIKFFDEDNHFTKSAMLFDIILPSRDGRISSYLGIELTKAVLELGVRKIAFLSVVFEDEITSDLKTIQTAAEMKNVVFDFKFFDKTRIIDSKTFSELIDFLKVSL